MRSKLTTIILIGMVLGILVGYACHTLWPDPKTAKTIADYISLLTDIFLRLIKMIIAPLVFSTLVVGIAHMGDAKAVGRIGAKAMVWFVGASLVSLLLGLILVNLLRPGDNLSLPLPDAQASTNLKVALAVAQGLRRHLVPRSIVEAMANNEILQIVVFSMFFGVACAALGERARKLVEGIEELAHVMLTITGYIMVLAPIAVFAAMAATVTTQGLGILVTYGKFMVEFYFGLVVLWCLLIAAGFLILGRHVFRLVNLVREPFLLAFSTASTEAAYPKTMEQLERSDQQEDHQLRAADGLFVQPRRLDDVLHLRDAVHRAGLQHRAVARTADHDAADPDAHQQGHGGRAARLAGGHRGDADEFNIPEAGLLLIIGVDQFLDMGRSATNVIGNSLATAVVAKWEGEKVDHRGAGGRARADSRVMRVMPSDRVLRASAWRPSWHGLCSCASR